MLLLHMRDYVALCGQPCEKQSLDRPWGFQKVDTPRFNDNQHVKVGGLSALCSSHLYLQEIFLVLISVTGWIDPRVIMRPEGLRQWKIPMTSLGIEPATSWFVAQYLNQLHHHVHAYSPLSQICHMPLPFHSHWSDDLASMKYSPSSSLYNFLQHSATFSLICQWIFLSTLFSGITSMPYTNYMPAVSLICECTYCKTMII
jgi:hypothetical protein